MEDGSRQSQSGLKGKRLVLAAAQAEFQDKRVSINLHAVEGFEVGFCIERPPFCSTRIEKHKND